MASSKKLRERSRKRRKFVPLSNYELRHLAWMRGKIERAFPTRAERLTYVRALLIEIGE